MTTIARIVLIAAAGSACLFGSATAAEMSGDEIAKLISGKSIYLEVTATSAAGAGQGVIYYAVDGTSLYKTAKGVIWHGKWAAKGNTVCNDWKESPGNPCTKYDKVGDAITIINSATGQARGKITKVADGNPEKLAP